jgi:hypothetical protein
LEDEVISIQGLKSWSQEQEIPQRGGGICSRVVAADISHHPNPNKEWKKSKMKTEDLLALLNNSFLREKEMDMWHPAAGDPYPMENNPDEVPMFARFVEHELELSACDFFKGLLQYYGIKNLNLNPNSIFHVSIFVHFCEQFVGIKPHWILFRNFFLVKLQPSANDPRVVRGAGIQMREDATDQ